jgi:hypothetical protein
MPTEREDGLDDHRGPAHDQLCGALRGEDGPLSAAVVELARRHRIHLVLADMAGMRVRDEDVRAGLTVEVRAAAVTDLFRERELRRLIGSLADEGIRTLLLKGAGLAYTVYSAPHLRPRTDVDMLIAQGDVAAADRAITGAGWTAVPEQRRESVTTQRHYALRGVPGCAEHLDLHWKIAVPHVFRNALTFEELDARAVPIHALGPNAWTLSAPDALLLACVHRAAHHQDAIDLVWLWDIHLLAGRLTDTERRFFVNLATARRMRAVCIRGLEAARVRFETANAADLAAMMRPRGDEPAEPSAAFLDADMRQVDILRRNLSAIGWRGGIQLLGAHLLPSPAYMRSIDPDWPACALPLAYLHRALRGAPAWFRRPGG